VVRDTSLRDTENVSLTEDIESYFAREVLPFAPDDLEVAEWLMRK